ncbi:MAG: cell surface protein SprA [Bacteroidetes bacterium HGW-Bacteroidetes-6]|nr:MAG: cell surface protein SprA [Bacteroidetes bacterium HGW-Bacteroidetes-6]
MVKGYLFFPVATTLAIITAQVISPVSHNPQIHNLPVNSFVTVPVDTPPPGDTLPFPFNDDPVYSPQSNNNPLFFNDPKNISDTVIFDPETGEYIFQRKVGSLDYRPSFSMNREEYYQYDFDKAVRDYWLERSSAAGKKHNGNGLQFNLPLLGNEGIFGSNTIDIRPSGTAELIFGINANRRDDPALNVKQRRTANFDFQEKIQMNVQAKIGDKVDFGVKYNTESSFEFENKMKLQYEGKEDEIIKSIEAGDVTLPLNSTLINGSQSLFGIKSKLQFGKVTVTSVISQQKGQTSNITVTGGAQTSDFELYADEYEEKKHFLVSQYFRNNYNNWLENMPVIGSPINITKMEVWVTNIGPATQENRNIVAMMDLGEQSPYNTNITGYPTSLAQFPDNESNDLLDIVNIDQIRDINSVNAYLNGLGFTGGVDYEKIENARLLAPTEYTYNSKLGFISLNSTLNDDQVLAVAFQYTVLGSDSVFQVGEFSNGGIAAPGCLMVKLLKSTAQNTKIPLWGLMMKNVYAIGGYQVNPEDFRLDVLYKSDALGVPAGYLLEGNLQGIPLIRVLNMDNLNANNDPEPDGIFDFIDNAATIGGTINAKNGRIFFPMLEPFGQDLRNEIGDQTLADKYCYDSLYTMTKTGARQYPNKNRFTIAGRFKSSVGNEISLNAMNIPQGSVKVTAGGILLTENVDYTVDYTLGRLKIINEGILNSGAPINISLESNSLFSIQTKTFLGTHIDYEVNRNLLVGATILNLTERPFTYKVNIGEEPISNTMWGLNLSYQTESRLLTKAVDALPFIQTKAVSKVNIDAEVANLIPGHARAIGKTGTAYIDDFEGSKSSIDIKNVGTWFISSVPQGQSALFPEAANDTTLASGFNRAKLAWYVIDPLFFRNNNLTPDHIRNDPAMQSNHYMREVLETEVFPYKQNANNIVTNIAVLDLAYYPSEKGPYNYDVDPTPVSAGIDADGNLNDPASRWAGIMRKVETPDFEETNVEYIEFWVMDPFIYNPSHSGGKLIFDIGDISEDVLRDHRKSYENGLPTSATIENVDSTQWGRVPLLQALVNSFDNDPTSREFQDVGLDGLSDADENSYFYNLYVNAVGTVFGTGSNAYLKAVEDPSTDNFHYFRGSDYDTQELDILERYKKYNGVEKNSPTSEQSPETYPTSSTTLPNVEDINRDNTLNESERYFQYEIDLEPSKMNVGENYITDVFTASPRLADGTTGSVKWYQFKIPVKDPDLVVGGIQDFKSIRFIRVLLKDFAEPVVLRFATLELARSQWRKYDNALLYPGEYIPSDDQNGTSFDISAVNVEENGSRTPIPYVLPPGIEREVGYGSTTMYEMNEQSLVLKACDLIDGDARAVYKTCDFDIRLYKRLKMFIHSELTSPDLYSLSNGDVSLFIRLGTDFTNNFYEYEIPLHPTPLNVSAQDPDIRQLVWADSLDLELSKLTDLKKARNIAMRLENSTVNLMTPYYQYDGENKMTIMGIPNLSDVRTIMIGVRNPKRSPLNLSDDGMAKCFEVWVNELRLSDFDEDGGWAATTRVTADLADLGNVAMVGNVSTAGFGSIEKKVSERQKDNIMSYDFATNLELGKFLPEKSGLKIPMHFDISESFSNPQYNPLNPDLYLRDDLETYSTQAEKDSILNIVQDYTRRKSLNFVNIRKEKTGGNTKTHIYDLSNFDLTYAYNEVFQRNIEIEYNLKKNYRGALGYNYSNTPKNYQPFKKVKLLQKKAFKLIGDFNFYLLPKSLSFRTDLDRGYEENLWRNKTDALIIIEPSYLKTFNWNRTYSMKFDLTKSIKVDFNAMANARVDEPPGKLDKEDSEYQAKMDSIWQNIKSMGRITNYNQSLKVNYAIPVNKLPMLDWISSSAQYSGDYKWIASPLYKDSLGNYAEHPYGNTIENNRSISINTNGNMVTLYNKIPYLKKLNQKSTRPTANNRRVLPTDSDSSDVGSKDTTALFKKIADNFLRFLMMTKNLSLAYTLAEGTYVPGYRGGIDILGMDLSRQAPGWGFVFGDQRDIRPFLVQNDLLSKDSLLNNAYATRRNENLNARVSLEPSKNMKIELTAMRNFTANHSEYFKYDEANNNYRSYSAVDNGSFSMSIITWKTAFISDYQDYSNQSFEDFKNIRPEIAAEVAQGSGNWDGTYFTDTLSGLQYPTGYGPTSQEVLIPAFLTAYTGANPSKYIRNTFPRIPLPNWRLTYSGLTEIPWFKKRFKSATISHAYRSTYNIGGYTSNVLFSDSDGDGFTFVKDAMNNFLPRYEIAQVSITEQFSPLINIDLTWKNSLISKIEYKKSRNLAMSFSNNQLTEVISGEITLGLGYRIKDVEFEISNKPFKSDLSLKADFSIRNNKTVLRKIVENVDQISAGQKIISVNLSAEYMLSQKFTIRAFFDKVINNPYISSQFLNSNTNAGISLRFSLAQ